MTDPKHIEESLNRLRSEIDALHIHDDEARRRLATLIRDIEKTLDDPKTEGADQSLGDRLKASIVSFEASHPRIASLMNDVMEKLGNIGI
jgi:hypothetical protein